MNFEEADREAGHFTSRCANRAPGVLLLGLQRLVRLLNYDILFVRIVVHAYARVSTCDRSLSEVQLREDTREVVSWLGLSPSGSARVIAPTSILLCGAL